MMRMFINQKLDTYKNEKNINLLKDDIFKLFWKIALPSSIGTIFQNLYSLVDAVFAGRMISEMALAAIGQTFPIYFIIIALGIGLSIATTSIVANSVGENNLKKASKYSANLYFLQCCFTNNFILRY